MRRMAVVVRNIFLAGHLFGSEEILCFNSCCFSKCSYASSAPCCTKSSSLELSGVFLLLMPSMSFSRSVTLVAAFLISPTSFLTFQIASLPQ